MRTEVKVYLALAVLVVVSLIAWWGLRPTGDATLSVSNTLTSEVPDDGLRFAADVQKAVDPAAAQSEMAAAGSGRIGTIEVPAQRPEPTLTSGTIDTLNLLAETPGERATANPDAPAAAPTHKTLDELDASQPAVGGAADAGSTEPGGDQDPWVAGATDPRPPESAAIDSTSTTSELLRPRLDPGLPPPAGAVEVPAVRGGSEGTTQAPAATARATQYEIREGDTFWSISVEHYGDGSMVAAIQAANPGMDERRLLVGKKITLPPKGSWPTRTAPATRDPSARRAASPPGPAASQPAGRAVYVVEQGDTLISIARNVLGDAKRYLEIYELNKEALSSPDNLPVGAELRMPPVQKP